MTLRFTLRAGPQYCANIALQGHKVGAISAQYGFRGPMRLRRDDVPESLRESARVVGMVPTCRTREHKGAT